MLASLRSTTGISLTVCTLAALALTTVATAQDLAPVTVSDMDASDDGFYYSLRTNSVVPADDVSEDNWDLQFQSTAIAVSGEARLLERAFDLVAQAPESGYAADSNETGPAIPGANHEGWYDYDPGSHIVMPIPDRTIVLKLTDGTYAKLEILGYYEGMLPEIGQPRFYTFRFVHQPNGSRSLR